MAILGQAKNIVEANGNSGGGKKIFTAYPVSTILAVAVNATDITFNVVDASKVPIGYYWDVNSIVTAVDLSTNIITLSRPVGASAPIGTPVTFIPMAGTSAVLTIPELTEPTQISFWGAVGSDGFSSMANWISDEAYHYTAVSGDAFRTGAYSMERNTPNISVIGAALSLRGDRWGELIYNSQTHQIAWDSGHLFGVSAPHIYALSFST